MEATLEERVSTLEDAMVQAWRAIAETQHQLNQLALEMRLFKDEMSAFKDEMLAFKEEMLAFKEEMRLFKEEMLAFKEEMRLFKEEMREFKDQMLTYREEAQQELRDWKKKWGELANKMGTMAEDLVAPSVPRILRTTVACPEDRVESIAVRVRRHPLGQPSQEFDVVAVCGEYVLINETKSRLKPDDIPAFVRVMERARVYFPEYADKKFIGAIASLYVEEGLVHYGERMGLIVLGFGEDVMDVLNSPGFQPAVF